LFFSVSYFLFSIHPKLHVLTTHTFRLQVLKKRKVEDHDNFILGPMSPKEYKEMVAELNGSRTNRVFEFFKIVAPECVGFTKHHEAAERKAVALATADAEAGKPQLHRAPPRRGKSAGERLLPLPPPPPPKEKRGRNVVAGRRTRLQRPKEPGLWTSRLASSKT
jgi:hypothetical protein